MLEPKRNPGQRRRGKHSCCPPHHLISWRRHCCYIIIFCVISNILTIPELCVRVCYFRSPVDGSGEFIPPPGTHSNWTITVVSVVMGCMLVLGLLLLVLERERSAVLPSSHNYGHLISLCFGYLGKHRYLNTSVVLRLSEIETETGTEIIL